MAKAHPPQTRWLEDGAIAVGGALGALLRFGLGELAAAQGLGPIAATWCVNTLGCLSLGLLAGWPGLHEKPHWHAFWSIGLLGSFTTFSALAAHTHLLASDGRTGSALLHLIGSLCVGIGAFRVAQRGVRVGSGRAR